MNDLVEKLTGRKQSAETHEVLSSVIFGSGISLDNLLDDANKARLRVGFWPLQSKSLPETAMGIAAVLGFLLERWPSIQVYRLFARLDGVPANYQWSMNESQFGVDDWELEGLDENVAIWGSLEKIDGQFTLTLEIENDLVEDDPKVLKSSADTLDGLIAKLIPIVKDIAEYLDAGEVNPLSPVYQINKGDENVLQELLKQAFLWELHLFLSLWGKTRTNEEIGVALQSLTAVGSQVKHDLGAWLVSSSVARALSLMEETPKASLLEKVGNVAEAFDEDPVAAIILSLAVAKADDFIQAFDYLESSVDAHPESALNWLALAGLYQQKNELASCIDTLQRAIEADVTSAALYMRYAELMQFLQSNNLAMSLGAEHDSAGGIPFTERLVLVDPEEEADNILVHEAGEAYQAALEFEPNNIEALHQFTAYLVNENDETRLWSQFAKLVKNDPEGEHIRSVVDLFYNVEDFSNGLKILETEVSENPDRPDLHISLAAAYLIAEDGDAARNELEKAHSLSADDKYRLAEIDRLLLAVNDPDFEARIGQITDLIDAGNELLPDDVEFLEETLDESPSFSEGYILLASAYLAWDENDDALEVLLDGQKHAPEDPQITMMLARLLWDAEAEDLAFEYLNKAIAQNPSHVGLLALTGRYLFEDGQDVAAKEFLARAEALNPGDPVLKQARAYIARTLSDIETDT